MPADSTPSGTHRRARRRALQALYAWESRGASPDAAVPILAAFATTGGLPHDQQLRADTVVRLVVQNLDRIDSLLSEQLDNWRLDRVAAIDRNVLRLGLAELLFLTRADDPEPVDAMTELAARYGSPQSPRFVHGVLEAVQQRLSATDPPVVR